MIYAKTEHYKKKVMFMHYILPLIWGSADFLIEKSKMETKIREYLVCKYGAAFSTVIYFKLNLFYVILFLFCTLQL